MAETRHGVSNVIPFPLHRARPIAPKTEPKPAPPHSRPSPEYRAPLAARYAPGTMADPPRDAEECAKCGGNGLTEAVPGRSGANECDDCEGRGWVVPEEAEA